jgi:hypothetical protein
MVRGTKRLVCYLLLHHRSSASFVRRRGWGVQDDGLGGYPGDRRDWRHVACGERRCGCDLLDVVGWEETCPASVLACPPVFVGLSQNLNYISGPKGQVFGFLGAVVKERFGA